MVIQWLQNLVTEVIIDNSKRQENIHRGEMDSVSLLNETESTTDIKFGDGSILCRVEKYLFKTLNFKNLNV